MEQKKNLKYGPYRTLEPENTLPNLAWKLDTSLPIRKDEILVRVKIINVNAASFDQIAGGANPDPKEIAKKLMNIISLRGKLHNPITGTGGTLAGEIEEVGILHEDYGKLKKGDRICTLASTSMNPLHLDRILEINVNTRQIKVEGYAILFRDSFYTKIPDGWNPGMYLAIVGEAGSCYESALRCRQDSTVLLIGASEKVGMMSLYALREKLGNTGRLIALTRKEKHYAEIKALQVADQVIVSDFQKPLESYETILKALPENTVIDYTVDCSSVIGHEMTGVLLTRENGTVYFANPAASHSEASLGAEGIGKEIELLFYRGYIKGHVAFCMRLAEKYPGLREWFRKRYCSENKEGIYQIPRAEAVGELAKDPELSKVVISGPEMEQVVKTAKRTAGYNTTVLIEGESGTGKEVIANIVQQFSGRKDKPFIKINCAAISDSLFESEFFGYDAGSFTGALKNGKAGHFENADGGTLFLDEIGELSLQNQVKLLRVLQSKEVVRVGASKPRKIDVRLIAATNRNLKEMSEKGEFREDLYYRLNVINIRIPPLRERPGDIQGFIENFVQVYEGLYGIHKQFSPAAIKIMKHYHWPGNVRELENMVQRLMLTTEGEMILPEELPHEMLAQAEMDYRLFEAEQNSGGLKDSYLKQAEITKETAAFETQESRGNRDEVQAGEEERYREAVTRYRSTREIAKAFNTSQPTVVRRLKKYGLRIQK